MNKLKSCCVYVLLFFFLTAPLLFTQTMDKNVKAGFDSIQPMNPYNYCKTMASERFDGRLTGHEGYTAAAKWAAEYFKQWGLSGYLQSFPNPYVIIDKAEMTLIIDGKAEPLKPQDDFLPTLFSDSGSNKSSLVFTGWGIHAPELGYDDYEGVDVKGKFVLCFRGTPDPENKALQDHDQHRHRMKVAKEKGSLGLIYIYEEVQSNPNGDWIQGFTPGTVSYKTADKILKEKDFTAEKLRSELTSTKKPKSFPLNAEIDFRVEARPFPDGTGYNVVGIIEGSDPQLKKECIVFGGHFDHNGRHMGLLFPGANDNASGSAVVMEIAHAFSIIGKKPKRSLVFVLFGSEEQGLKGSYYFAEHIPPQFTRVDSMFNFDMNGEGDKTVAVISKEPPVFEKTMKEADEFVHTLQDIHYIRGIGVRSSDYAPFYLKGASCISFFSNGPHLHYHKTGDTIYRINPDIMADIAKLAYLTAYTWANR